MSEKEKVVIIGAGKTGRGFLARLVQESGKEVIFIDKDKELVENLREKKTYKIHFFGKVRESYLIGNYKIYHWEDEGIEDELRQAVLLLVSVGGEHLAEVGNELNYHLSQDKMTYIITAENASSPALKLRKGIEDKPVSVSESTVFCTTIEAEGLDISSENYPYLQYNADLLEGYSCEFSTFKPIRNFEHFLTRKLYTYNAASCIIAYLGWKKGYEVYSEAANDPEILSLLEENYKITNRVLCKEFGYEKKDQEEFALLSKKKFCDPSIADTVERNGRDPGRKLAGGERLMGPLRLFQQYGEDTSVLERTIAAAIEYDHPKETEWKKLKTEYTKEEILEKICKIKRKEEIFQKILRYIK